jgi:electron transfer flavoprotein-quinone oxidoreductase
MTETPNYDDHFDAIVVGAGPAGSAAALTMAGEGLEVILIERGAYPGAKNVFGGVLFTPTIRELVGEAFDDAPLERYVSEKQFSLLSEHDETALSISPGAWHEEPHNDSYTVLRGKFDEWFAEQAVEAGATLITETTVTGLIRENDAGGDETLSEAGANGNEGVGANAAAGGDADRGAIVGVETDRPDGRLRAPIVVLAEGGNSLVSEGADLKKPDAPHDVAVAAKEVRKYDRETIEERFNLYEDDGAAYHYFGDGACGDAVGGAFIYTNKRTLAIGLAYSIDDARQSPRKPDEMLNDFKQHPAVAPLVRGGRLVEYSAKTIPEGGADAIPQLVHDGAVIVGDAASLTLNNGIHLEGTNMAVDSGQLAAEAIVDALENGRADAEALEPYAETLRSSYVVENLEHYNWFGDFAAQEKEFLFEELPRALTEAEREYFRVDTTPKADHVERAKQMLLQATGGWFGAIKQAWKYRRLLS